MLLTRRSRHRDEMDQEKFETLAELVHQHKSSQKKFRVTAPEKSVRLLKGTRRLGQGEPCIPPLIVPINKVHQRLQVDDGLRLPLRQPPDLRPPDLRQQPQRPQPPSQPRRPSPRRPSASLPDGLRLLLRQQPAIPQPPSRPRRPPALHDQHHHHRYLAYQGTTSVCSLQASQKQFAKQTQNFASLQPPWNTRERDH